MLKLIIRKYCIKVTSTGKRWSMVKLEVNRGTSAFIMAERARTLFSHNGKLISGVK